LPGAREQERDRRFTHSFVEDRDRNVLTVF